MLRTCVHRGAAGGLAAAVGLAGLAVLGGSALASAPVSPAKAGTVATWGPGVTEADSGVPGGIVPPTLPAEEANTTFVKALANGPTTLLALTTDGRVVRAGTPVYGTTAPTLPNGDTPPVLPAGTVVKDIAADSYEGGAAVTQAGDVVTWGPGIEGFLTSPPSSPLHDIKAIAVEPSGGAYAAAVTSAGGVVAWGTGAFPEELDVPDGLTGVTQVTVSNGNMYALKADGTVVAWGTDVRGGVSGLPAVLTDTSDDVDVTDVVANGTSAVALLSDGSLVAWGSNTSLGTPAGTLNDVPADLTGKTVIALGGDGSTRYEAVDSDGNAYVWGDIETTDPADGDAAPADPWTQLPSDIDATKIATLSLNNYFATALVTTDSGSTPPPSGGGSTPPPSGGSTTPPSTGGDTSDAAAQLAHDQAKLHKDKKKLKKAKKKYKKAHGAKKAKLHKKIHKLKKKVKKDRKHVKADK